MKKLKYFLILPFILLSSCNNDNAIKSLCPLGAPCLAFYSELNNNNFVTTPTPSTIAKQFMDKSEYDALVIDSITGLNLIKNKNSDFRFARLLTAGNLYFVGLVNSKQTIPDANSKIVAFGKDNLTGIVFNKLLNDNPTWKAWGVDTSKIEWFNSVSDIAPIIKAGTYGGEPVDFALIADPIKTNLKDKLNTFNISLKDAWKEYTGNDDIIPQAALFINSSTYNNKKSLFKDYINKINNCINTAINDPNKMKDELDKLGDDEKVANKFNFTSTIANNVMKDKNGYALYSSDEEYSYDKMNMFMNELNNTSGEIYYKQEYFININD